MSGILRVAFAHVATAIRERHTLFWFLIFPIFLLVLLTLIFGNVGQEGEINFDIGLLNRDGSGSSSGDFASIIVDTFHALGAPDEGGREPLFSLHEPGDGDDHGDFLEDELTSLRRGRRAAVVVIPEGFSAAVLGAMLPADAAAARLIVYMTASSVASQMAAEIIDQVLAEFDREVLVRGGRFDPADEIGTETRWLGQTGEETPYVDFLLPGIILMGFFVNGLFGVPGAILFNRDQKILRRYWVTPLSVPRFLTGFGLGHLSLCALQFVLLFLLGRYAFGADISFASLGASLTLVLGAVTFMAFGFLIASLAKTANAGMATANILNMPMMFLSGMFFPIAGLPLFLRAIVYANPVSYLVSGLRAQLGVETASLPLGLTIGIPLAWIAVSVLVASRKLKWDVER